MTALTPFGPGSITGNADPFQAHERSRIRAAARHARRMYPGELGELVFRELSAYAEFGIRFSVDALIPRLATLILAMPSDDGADVTSIVAHHPTTTADHRAAS
jgi:hypothetical protein